MSFDAPPGLNLGTLVSSPMQGPRPIPDVLDLSATPTRSGERILTYADVPMSPTSSSSSEGSDEGASFRMNPRLIQSFLRRRDPSPTPEPRGDAAKFMPQKEPSFADRTYDHNNRLSSISMGCPLQLYKNAEQLLRTRPPELPSIYRSGALTSTKLLNKEEKTLDPDIRLSKIVFSRGLVEQLFCYAEVLLEALEIDWNNTEHIQFVARVLPELWAPLLPQTVNSEKDVGKWVDSTLLDTAMTVLRCLREKRIGLHKDPIHPFLASAPSSGVIADGILVSKVDARGAIISMTIEHKSPNVLLELGGSIFDVLCEEQADTPEGLAAKFVWPNAQQQGDHLTRILAQVWTQMLKNKCLMGILTSCETTYFFARSRDHPDTLYISPPYTRENCPVYACFCWFAVANGNINRGLLKLPRPNADWWSDWVKNNDDWKGDVGVVEETLLRNYRPPTPPTSSEDDDDYESLSDSDAMME